MTNTVPSGKLAGLGSGGLRGIWIVLPRWNSAAIGADLLDARFRDQEGQSESHRCTHRWPVKKNAISLASMVPALKPGRFDVC